MCVYNLIVSQSMTTQNLELVSSNTMLKGPEILLEKRIQTLEIVVLRQENLSFFFFFFKTMDGLLHGRISS